MPNWSDEYFCGSCSWSDPRKYGTIDMKFTSEGGLAVQLTNKTGAASVRGTLVHTASATASAFEINPIGDPDCIGVVYDTGVADGSECWVVVCGVADVLFIDSSSFGHFARVCAATDANAAAGMAISEAVPTPPFATDKHFMEIGHVLEARAGSGLAKVELHFN